MKSRVIYQSTDLQRRGRDILRDAREGGARLRDKDGVSLVMMREDRICALEELTNATSSYVILDAAFHANHDPRAWLADLGEWTWLRVFDPDDLQEFLNDMRQALIAGSREHRSEPILATLDAWRKTAESLDDPLRREILLGEVAAEDMTVAKSPSNGKRIPAVSAS